MKASTVMLLSRLSYGSAALVAALSLGLTAEPALRILLLCLALLAAGLGLSTWRGAAAEDALATLERLQAVTTAEAQVIRGRLGGPTRHP